MEEILHQLIGSLSPFYRFYRVLSIPGGAGFLPSAQCIMLVVGNRFFPSISQLLQHADPHMFLFVFLALRLFLGGRIAHYSWAFETENNKILKHFFVAFLRDGQVTVSKVK